MQGIRVEAGLKGQRESEIRPSLLHVADEEGLESRTALTSVPEESSEQPGPGPPDASKLSHRPGLD